MTDKPYTGKEKKILDERFKEIFEKYVIKKGKFNLQEQKGIKKAYNFAKKAHEVGKLGEINQRRKTGALFMTHPLSVFEIGIKDMSLGYMGLVATLLHDVLEDTQVSETELCAEFGKEIVHIVNGVTKLTHDRYSEDYSHNTQQVANFKHLLMDLGTYNILLVKIADRLHNMRTMAHLAENKRFEKAAETTYIFVPIAHKLGLSNVKKELENLSLKYRHHSKYEQIMKLFKHYENDRIAFKKEVKNQLSNAKEVLGLRKNPKIKVIRKSCYSIYRRMERQNNMYENIEKCLRVNEIYKINIVIEEPKDENLRSLSCWKLYSFLGAKFNIKTSRLRDWMTTPKGIGYQSIHIPIMNKSGKIWKGLWFETKIRTESIHKIVRKGFDMHGDSLNNEKIGGTRRFVESLIGNSCHGKEVFSEDELDILRQYFKEMSNKDFHQVTDMLKIDEITIYDQKGTKYVVNGGATILDFAYKKVDERGQNLGFRCCGALLNGTPAILNTVLQHEDQVELKFYAENERREEDNFSEKLSMVRTLKAKAIILKKMNTFTNGLTYRISPCCNPIKGDEVYVKKSNNFNMDIHRTTCLESLAHDGTSIYCESNIKVTGEEEKLGVKKIYKEDIWRNKDSFLVSIKVEGVNKDKINKHISDIISEYDIVSSSISLLPTNSYYFDGILKFYVKSKDELMTIISSIYKVEGVKRCARVI